MLAGALPVTASIVLTGCADTPASATLDPPVQVGGREKGPSLRSGFASIDPAESRFGLHAGSDAAVQVVG